MGKLLLLTLNEQEETAIDKIISAISNYMRLEPMQLTPVSVLSFPGLEIRQSQRRVFQDGEEVNLTRLEYNALVFLASNPGIVLTRTQIFEAVWNMESDMDEFRTMQTLMLKVQKQAKAIKKIQEITLPNLRQQLAETTGIFKGKERKALEKQIQQTESELKEKLNKLPDILKDDGYPDVQAFMKTYRKAEAIITQYNQDLAEWEQTVKNGQKPAEKQHRPPERQSVRNRLRQLQEESKQSSQSKQRKKSQGRDR